MSTTGPIFASISATLIVCMSACKPALTQEYETLLPGGDPQGRALFGVVWCDTPEVIMLETTGMSPDVPMEVAKERFNTYLNTGYVPIGESTSRSSGEGPESVMRLAQDHGAAIVVAEVNDPPPTTKSVQGSRPTLYTESVRVTGTRNFTGDVTTIGWEPAMVDVWVDPYHIDARLWAKRSWPPVLGVYFNHEMSAFGGWASIGPRPMMKEKRDQWMLRHPGEPPPAMGAQISRVLSDTAAKAIGLSPNDLLLAVDDRQIRDEMAGRLLLNEYAGRVAQITVMRQRPTVDKLFADGWHISKPDNPLFEQAKYTPWHKMTRRVQLNVLRLEKEPPQ